MVAGVVAAASSDDITPVICTVQWMLEPGELRLVATDRYRVHTAVVPVDYVGEPVSFLASRELMIWLQKNATTFERLYRNRAPVSPAPSATAPVVVSFTSPSPDSPTDAGTIGFTVMSPEPGGSLSRSEAAVRGNFPPVLRLIEDARKAEFYPSEFVLKTKFMTDVGKLAQSPTDEPRLRSTKSEATSKPGVVLLSFRSNGVGDVYAEALLQPNLLLR
ncbi:hypothetical protein D9V32_14085 [Mycetocola tolaasinivorans]|uniref:DNA polymerase III beta sliding clamp central domain-containing protein n=2 Tax=Mycetocola tolaasinivorans TaxID=76635 RepID=A0A3L7A036_9MICO|nr:hypothetical protein D9V32_14085 [Mycetocola tolaasinivorans]